MTLPRRRLPAVILAALLVAACASEPTVTVPPATPTPAASVAVTAPPSEVPFERSAWPATGSACDTEGYTGRIGLIEAVDRRTVRFTLCRPDGAFLARIAHPALAIVDAASLARLAADPASARSLPGTGPYEIRRWDEDSGVILETRTEAATPATPAPTVLLRWAADPSQRTLELQSATVDGIDSPGAIDIDRIDSLPELAIVPRPGLAVAYLGFGNDDAFDSPRVRRAIASSLDRDALAAAAFPAGSVVPTHVTPCVVSGACGGKPWYATNAPAAAAELASAKFNLSATYPLHIPNRAIAGLPDPAGAAKAVQAGLKDAIGLETEIDVMTPKDYNAGVAAGDLDGLYLGAVGSSLADPSVFLEPLFGGRSSLPAKRATRVAAALAQAASTGDQDARAAAFATANDAILSTAPLVPLVNPGSVVAFRSDVEGVVTSPLGLEPLGAFVPGDRRQLVFMQATEPTSGAYCGDQASADAYRLCALVTESLYGFAAGKLSPEPRLAQRCTPNDDATVWTCTLRDGVQFGDGAALDAGDVLASYIAQWDATSPLRVARPDAAFPAWQTLFGGFLGTPPG